VNNGTYIIAEIGSNHDQSLTRAMLLISAAKVAGADAAKFQLYRADSLVERRNAEAYREIYEATEMPVTWLPRLKEYCDYLKIDFMCTAYDEWGVGLVAPYVDLFKVASFELTDHKLLLSLRDTSIITGKKVVLSTGMGDMAEVLKAVQIIGFDNLAYVLHCTSSYPCQLEDANLKAILTLKWELRRADCAHRDDGNDLYQIPIGLSDHTTNILTPSIAVGLGARAIEKHFTDDKTRKGPDHHFAIEPQEFKEMVGMVREAEMLLGDGEKRARDSEKEMMEYRSYTKLN